MSDLEKWRPVPSYPGYEVSDQNRIRNRGRERKLQVNVDGYYWLPISNTTVLFHRLVCEAFNGPKPFEDAKALHKDGIRSNCHPDNLYWGTSKQNADDRRVHGNSASLGERNPHAKITTEQAQEIRNLRKAGHTTTSLGKRFGLTASTICNIVAGRLWKEPV